MNYAPKRLHGVVSERCLRLVRRSARMKHRRNEVNYHTENRGNGANS